MGIFFRSPIQRSKVRCAFKNITSLCISMHQHPCSCMHGHACYLNGVSKVWVSPTDLRVIGFSRCSYDLDDPEIRCDLDLPTQSGGSKLASFRSLDSFSRIAPSTPTPTNRRLDLSRRSSSDAWDTETNPDYAQDMPTPARKHHWVLCGEEF